MLAEPRIKPSTNLALADLDELISGLLQREFKVAGMSGVEITFEAPTRERTATWPSPALNIFLYDLREPPSPRDRGYHQRNGAPATMVRSPLRLACSFAITAWTQRVVDEHKLLSQVLSVLLAYPSLTPDMLPPSLLVGTPPVGLSTRVGQAKEEGRADFWTAIGSPYKVSLEYMVTILCVSGMERDRGPAAGSATIAGMLDGGEAAGGRDSGAVHAQGGQVVDAGGQGVQNAWVVIPAGGPWTTTGAGGRFLFEAIAAGTHELEVRTADGRTARATVTVPGPGPVLTLR